MAPLSLARFAPTFPASFGHSSVLPPGATRSLVSSLQGPSYGRSVQTNLTSPSTQVRLPIEPEVGASQVIPEVALIRSIVAVPSRRVCPLGTPSSTRPRSLPPGQG